MLPKFYKCQKKAKSRQDTIIDFYRKLFSESLPVDKQYWTICNYQADENGNLGILSEIGQLVESKLLTLNQVHGVDRGIEYIKHNRKHIPQANWYHNDLYRQMIENNNQNNFNPAIINLDYNCMINRSIKTSIKVLNFLNWIKAEDVMVVINTMMNTPYKRSFIDIDLITNSYLDHRLFHRLKDWDEHPEVYVYNGTGKKSQTVMASIILWK